MVDRTRELLCIWKIELEQNFDGSGRENSIKDSERKLRGAVDTPYIITGPEQTFRQSGQKLLHNVNLKKQLSLFLLREWKNDHYLKLLAGKTLFVSYGGKCYKYVPDYECQSITVEEPTYLQGNHEEADTLIAFHVANITGDVVVRASDTDVLVILIGALGNLQPENRAIRTVIIDCGSGNNRRYINVTNIVNNLEDLKPGLSRAMPGYHAFTGCDFTSAFFRKGKLKPLNIIEKDDTDLFVKFLISLGNRSSHVDIETASEFVCRIYGQRKTRDTNEARYLKLMEMSGNIMGTKSHSQEDNTEAESSDEAWSEESEDSDQED
ncbi:uncharacterized protein LOC134456421 [Engraulis encrasicolus]|uniref:uncharacterized protein LOC134456421 n=1 Tax=Engraulis encrasicolus TaxID=184585 RepID=UPI002FD2E438